MPDGSGRIASFVDPMAFGPWSYEPEDVDAAIAAIDNAPTPLTFLDAIEAAGAQPAVVEHLRREGRGWLFDEDLLNRIVGDWFRLTDLDFCDLPQRDCLLVAGLFAPDEEFADLLAGEH